MSKITFEKARPLHKEIVFAWLEEPHIQEFWDNTQAHKDDIINFIGGRKTISNYCGGKYIYWIACIGGKPYAMLMTIKETFDDNLGKIKLLYLSQKGNSYGLDYMIGNTEYLGKGYGSKTLDKFICFFRSEFDIKADTFLIDPVVDNHKAKRVYEKAGFKHVDDFIMQEDCSGKNKKHSLFVKKFESNFALTQDLNKVKVKVTLELARKLIEIQFPEYSHLPISEVEKQGHDNRSYRLGKDMLIRMPSALEYALRVNMEHKILPKLARHFTNVQIPVPLRMGEPSCHYPFQFSIYRYLPGKSINLLTLNQKEKEQLAFDLSCFLQKLHKITDINPLDQYMHSDRGNHVSIYDAQLRAQTLKLKTLIDSKKAIGLWKKACATKWKGLPIWAHGDLAVGNILVQESKLSAVIDFGSVCKGDPACDLVIAWTYFSGKSRNIFIKEMNLDSGTWLRAGAWALWKATYELCNMEDKNNFEANLQKRIIDEILSYNFN